MEVRLNEIDLGDEVVQDRRDWQKYLRCDLTKSWGVVNNEVLHLILE